MSYLDKVAVGGATYDIADSEARAGVDELKSALNNVRERTYNFVDCNNASAWVPAPRKDVTVTIPSADTVRIKSNISQTYAAARYQIYTTGISSVYVAIGAYTGTGQARARLYGDNSGTLTNLGTITLAGGFFDVSAYDTCWVELCETVETASDGYMDYSRVIVAVSDTAVAYVPYYTYKIDSALADIDELKTNAEESNAEIKKLNDATFITSYNLVDCNSAENWHAENNKDVTVTIPSDDTVRITSNVSQTYAAAYYPLDTSKIDTLYCSIAGYSGTGVARVRLFGGVYGGTPSPVPLGTITIAGKTFDVSEYDNCYVEISATTGTAGTEYMDYTGILTADSSVPLPYKPYVDGTESKVDSVADSVEAVEKATAPYGNKLYMIHRGARITAPENTMPAFILARELGFKYVETDVRYTSDMVAVLLHDGTINRTARNADGSVIAETISIADITYEQALTYDFGIAAGEKYRGTKIPTLAEFLHWCKATGMIPVLEQKIRNIAEMNGVINALMTVGITEDFVSLSQTTGSLNTIHDRLPKGRFLLLNNTGITSELIQDFLNYPFLEAIVGNYTTFTSEAIDNCRNAGVKLYAHGYHNYSDIYATDDYVSGYIAEEGAI